MPTSLSELESLLARRQSLALDVLNDVEGAAEDLDQVERSLTVAVRERELAGPCHQ